MKKSEVVRGRKKTDKGCAFRQEFVSITERMGDVPGLSHLYPWMSSSATYRKAIQEGITKAVKTITLGFLVTIAILLPLLTYAEEGGSGQ